jgi:hypothetical protein
MSRGKLDKATAAQIEAELPKINDLRIRALHLHPGMLSMRFPPNSSIPVAAVCLHDVTSTLEEVRYALFEALAHIWWHRNHQGPSNEIPAVFFGRFYVDDAALRLYAAGEHMAKAIVCMLEIDSQSLKQYRRGPGDQGSEQSTVGKYLKAEEPGHQITRAVLKLIGEPEWLQTINYRNEWVHSKPPIVEGGGIEFERRNRLEVSANCVGVSFGGGDKPKYSVDDLLGIVKPAAFYFTAAVDEIVDYYIDYLKREPEKTMVEGKIPPPAH